MNADHMREFWDARAREDAYYFVDNEQAYRAPDVDRFFADGERALDDLLAETGSHLSPGDVVVDVGCGLGRITRALAGWVGRAGRVHAIDVSAEMLAKAKELSPGLEKVTWHHGDGTSLQPIPDRAATAVVSHVVFQHLPDPAITYGYVREMGRVLRPGGWAAFQVSNDPGVHEGRHRPPSRLRVLLGRAPKGQRDPAWRGSAVDLGELRAAAADGGLELEGTVNAGTQFCLVRLAAPADT
jgi:SAM-dependent methyltransferase